MNMIDSIYIVEVRKGSSRAGFSVKRDVGYADLPTIYNFVLNFWEIQEFLFC